MRRTLVFATALMLGVATAAAAQSYRTLVESRRVSGESELRVDLEFAVGELIVGGAERNVLYRMALVYDEERFEPDVRYRDGGRLSVGLDSRDRDIEDVDRLNQRLDLSLARDVPLELTATFGAADAEVELGDLSLRQADFETGASNATIRFSEPNRVTCETARFQLGAAEFAVHGLGNARCRQVEIKGGVAEIIVDFTGEWSADVATDVEIDMGLGELRLRLPETLGVRLAIERFLVGLDDSGFVKRGSDYYSRNYETADARVTIDIQAALGSIEVDWIGR